MSTRGIQLSFPELDFHGRDTVSLQEIAAKWSCTPQHIWNQRALGVEELLDEGRLPILNIGSPGVSRQCLRVPISGYRSATALRLSGPSRIDVLKLLPAAHRAALIEDLQRSLVA